MPATVIDASALAAQLPIDALDVGHRAVILLAW